MNQSYSERQKERDRLWHYDTQSVIRYCVLSELKEAQPDMSQLHLDAVGRCLTEAFMRYQVMMETRKFGQLFVSHAAVEDGARGLELAKHLELLGHQCWIAPRDIPSGNDWNTAIANAVQHSSTLILLASNASIKSQYVRAEVQMALNAGKKIFPLRLPDCQNFSEIDLRLGTIQALNWNDPVDLLAKELTQHLRAEQRA